MKIDEAQAVATSAHEGQKRWDGSPYITHPESVVNRLIAKGFTGDILVLGWLHDVLEDSNVGYDSIYAQFGNYIADALDHLTHREGESYAEYILRISDCDIAAIVKIADLEDNLSDLGLHKDQYHHYLKKQKQRIDKYELAKLFLQRCG